MQPSKCCSAPRWFTHYDPSSRRPQSQWAVQPVAIRLPNSRRFGRVVCQKRSASGAPWSPHRPRWHTSSVAPTCLAGTHPPANSTSPIAERLLPVTARGLGRHTDCGVFDWSFTSCRAICRGTSDSMRAFGGGGTTTNGRTGGDAGTPSETGEGGTASAETISSDSCESGEGPSNNSREEATPYGFRLPCVPPRRG